MTTWDDKPNDYDHALIMLADLREANEKLVASVKKGLSEITRLRALSVMNAKSWDEIVAERDRLRAEIARLKELKTPVSRQLLNVTKAAWDHAEEVNNQLRAEVDEKQQMIAALRDVLALSEAILKFHLIGTASAPASSTP